MSVTSPALSAASRSFRSESVRVTARLLLRIPARTRRRSRRWPTQWWTLTLLHHAPGRPLVVTCGVLGFSTQAFYKWHANPVSDRDWTTRTDNAIIDVHTDDPEFGYRFIADDLEAAGQRDERRPGVAAVLAEQRSGRPRPARAARAPASRPARRCTTTSSSGTSPPSFPTRCGSPTSPSTPPAKGKLYCLLDQGRVLEPDRRLGHRRPHDRQARHRRIAMAIARRQPARVVIVHSDRGSPRRTQSAVATPR